LVHPADDTRVLVKAALAGLEHIFRPGFRYQKAGVMLLELDSGRARQAGLFDEPHLVENPERPKLMSTLDAVNRRMGKGTLRLAGEGYKKRWKVRAERKSPRYTTRWDELATAMAR
jgi:DNA polymerase V